MGWNVTLDNRAAYEILFVQGLRVMTSIYVSIFYISTITQELNLIDVCAVVVLRFYSTCNHLIYFVVSLVIIFISKVS